METSDLGRRTAEEGVVTSEAELDELIARSVEAGKVWRDLGAERRAEILHAAGDVLQSRRADLLEVMGSECGKVLEQGDPEVSEAVDFAHYYAEAGRHLDTVQGAAYAPAQLTVVTPPWNFPVAIPAGSTLSALASGSPVVIKPAASAKRCGAVMVEALWAALDDAGVTRDVLGYVQVSERDLGSQLVGHASVDRVILTGAFETAEVFRSIRPDLPLLAETSGKNAIVVTPSADLDLAAKDVALSAFGHAGQKCSAASLVILVGSVATSQRFRRQLVDAVTSLQVGRPWEESAQVGPLIGPAEGKLLRALTTLGPGESWVIEPRRLDADGALWRPGVREGVRPGSEFHHVEYFGPVLGIMTAETLDEAIDLVNDVDYGLTSGLQSLDDEEIARWLERVEAGNLYVNRGITGAIVQRQPFGGWKRSSVGPGAKAGGPHYLVGLGTWSDRPVEAEEPKDPVSRAALVAARAAAVSDDDLAWLAGALHTDVQAWEEEFGVVRDRTGLTAEHNALRYHPIPVTLRYEGTRVVELVRLVAAGARAGSPMTVSAAAALPDSVQTHLLAVGAHLRHDDCEGWRALARELAEEGARVRLVGASAAEVAEATDGSPALVVFDGEVVTAGRVELLTFLREQAVSITAHRFGTPRPRLVPSAVPGPRP